MSCLWPTYSIYPGKCSEIWEGERERKKPTIVTESLNWPGPQAAGRTINNFLVGFHDFRVCSIAQDCRCKGGSRILLWQIVSKKAKSHTGFLLKTFLYGAPKMDLYLPYTCTHRLATEIIMSGLHKVEKIALLMMSGQTWERLSSEWHSVVLFPG